MFNLRSAIVISNCFLHSQDVVNCLLQNFHLKINLGEIIAMVKANDGDDDINDYDDDDDACTLLTLFPRPD